MCNHNHNIKVAYIMYNERPMSGLIRTQVISLLKEIKRQSPDIDLSLVAYWQPWVVLKFNKELQHMKLELIESGIKLENYAFLIFPSRYFLFKFYLFPILHYFFYCIFWATIGKRFDVVHCRSYFSSLVASELKYTLGYRCIFDLRSLFPEENLTAGKWTPKDVSYRMWKEHEKQTIALSDYSIAVSEPMVKSINDLSPKATAVLIPCCVDTKNFFYDEMYRLEYRNKHCWEDKIVVVYEGSLNLYKWNNIHNYMKYFSFFLKLCPNVHFLILTEARTIDFNGIISEYHMSSSQFTILSVTPKDLPKWLSAADIGIQVMSCSSDSHTRLGVKFVEYLSCNLPVIVNSHVGGAAHIVREHGVGAVIDLNDKDVAAREFLRLVEQLPNFADKCANTAQLLFSLEKCAQKYIDLYDAKV